MAARQCHVAACTMIAVGKGATSDGSVMVSHTDDAGGDTGDLRLVRIPAQTHAADAKRPVYRLFGGYPRMVTPERADAYAVQDGQVVNKPLGSIDQVPRTFGYLEQDYGLINDVQLSIGESTCNSKTYGWSSDLPYGHNLFSIGELTRVALERCDSARCAIQLMGDLAVQHGFYGDYSGTPEAPGHGSGEGLGIADKYGEVWIFHVLTGPNNASAVWAAQGLPDTHVTVIPNHFIIQELNLTDSDNFLASDNVMSFAQEMGWWKPEDGPFNFERAYTFPPPLDEPTLFIDGRTWRVFDRFAPSLQLQLELGYVHQKPVYPFSVAVDKPVEPEDIMDLLRDHYEGTKYDMTKGTAAGPFGNPVRYSGVTPGVRGAWQRSISLHRTLFSFVAQARPHLPDALGGIAWYGQSAPHGTVYVPFSCAQASVPQSYLEGKQSRFSTASAWWAFDFVNNWSSLRFDAISVDVRAAIKRLQTEAITRQQRFTQELADADPSMLVQQLEEENNAFAASVVEQWWALAWDLVSKFSDGFITTGEEEGAMASPGYPAAWLTTTNFASWPTVSDPTAAPPAEHAVTAEDAHVDDNAAASDNASTRATLAVALCLGVVVGILLTLLVLRRRHHRRMLYEPI
ncbi:TPA: hypothetical protein N0F65_012814 [Lagenidium giganteum]|uniref:Dipeptidase n=1 Tax=Lagenidium giganteum TaxID=4803 RepID=A0AAV2YHQ5_9STRA|nr:TPA: hypothetical protein N0F65_012814 [Lagenidium giganteum]